MAKISLCAAALFAMFVLAACGSSKSASGSSGNSSASSNANGKVSQADCQALGAALYAVTSTAVDGSFDYAKTRTFFDSFNAPDKIRDDFNRSKGLVDEIASVYEAAGVKSGDAPVGDEITKIQGSLHVSDSDKARNNQAFTSLSSWHSNGCD